MLPPTATVTPMSTTGSVSKGVSKIWADVCLATSINAALFKKQFEGSKVIFSYIKVPLWNRIFNGTLNRVPTVYSMSLIQVTPLSPHHLTALPFIIPGNTVAILGASDSPLYSTVLISRLMEWSSWQRENTSHSLIASFLPMVSTPTSKPLCSKNFGMWRSNLLSSYPALRREGGHSHVTVMTF